jgi:hypothetical protein
VVGLVSITDLRAQYEKEANGEYFRAIRAEYNNKNVGYRHDPRGIILWTLAL